MDPSTDMTDDRLAELLRSVVDDDALRSPNRDAVRSSFLAEYDRTFERAPADIAHIAEIGLHDRAAVRRGPRRHVLVPLVAAVLLLVVLGAVAFVRIIDERDEPVASVPTIPSVDAVPVGSELPAGSVVSSLGGGIRFELEEPAVLLERSDGHITLTFPSERGASVSFVDTEPAEFRARLSDAVQRRDVRIDPAVYRADSLRVEVTSAGRETWGCEVGAPCRLDDLSIVVAVGGDEVDNFVTTVDFPEGAGLVVVERYESVPPPIDPDLSDLLGRSEDSGVRSRGLAGRIIDTIEPLWTVPPAGP